MKTLHLLASTLIICGLISGIQSTCSVTACSFSALCSGYENFKTCQEAEITKCTDSDTVAKTALQAALKAKQLQCGASSASVSMVTLLLAAAVAYFKS